jgi:hypothetical protein
MINISGWVHCPLCRRGKLMALTKTGKLHQHHDPARAARLRHAGRLDSPICAGSGKTIQQARELLGGLGDWCNCQAVKETSHYPGPWHPVADQPEYPCSQDGQTWSEVNSDD